MSGLQAVVLGLMLGGGLTLTLWSLPPMRQMTLSERIGPYLADGGTKSRLLATEPVGVTPWPTMERLLGRRIWAARPIGKATPRPASPPRRIQCPGRRAGMA